MYQIYSICINVTACGRECMSCDKSHDGDADLSDIKMQESSNLLFLVEFPGSALHLSDEDHLTVEVQQVIPR